MWAIFRFEIYEFLNKLNATLYNFHELNTNYLNDEIVGESKIYLICLDRLKKISLENKIHFIFCNSALHNKNNFELSVINIIIKVSRNYFVALVLLF